MDAEQMAARTRQAAPDAVILVLKIAGAEFDEKRLGRATGRENMSENVHLLGTATVMLLILLLTTLRLNSVTNVFQPASDALEKVKLTRGK